jgi:hypothetical protein
MNLEDILNQLKFERSRLNQAISALARGTGFGPDSTSGSSPEEWAYERSAETHDECRSSSTYISSSESSVGGGKAWI